MLPAQSRPRCAGFSAKKQRPLGEMPRRGGEGTTPDSPAGAAVPAVPNGITPIENRRVSRRKVSVYTPSVFTRIYFWVTVCYYGAKNIGGICVFSPSVKQECHTVSTDRPQNYNGIDLMKFLCAILVFIAHVPPFQGEVSSLAKYVNFGLQHCICRLAVPFYFVSSGFFLFGKMSPDDLNTDAIKHYCFKLLRLLGTWYVLLFAGGTEHLWYLGATVVAVVLLCLCFRFHMRFRYIGVLACLLYGVGLLGDAYSGVIAPLENHAVLKYFFKVFELIFPTTRNGIFMGFIFVFMGAAIAQRKISLKPGTALIGFGISVVCLIAEVFLLKTSNMLRQYNMYVFLPPSSCFPSPVRSG